MTEKDKARKIETGKAMRYGWEATKKDIWYFVGLFAIYMVITGIFSTANREEDNFLLSILNFVVGAFMTAGLLKLLLDYYDGKKAEIVTVFKQFKYLLRIIGAQILVMLIVVAGLILLIVPGIIWALRYQFVLNLIVDKDMGIKEAMGESAKLTDGVKLGLLGFNLTAAGVMILGFLALGVGILVALPVIYLADIYIYRNLLKAA